MDNSSGKRSVAAATFVSMVNRDVWGGGGQAQTSKCGSYFYRTVRYHAGKVSRS